MQVELINDSAQKYDGHNNNISRRVTMISTLSSEREEWDHIETAIAENNYDHIFYLSTCYCKTETQMV